MAKFLHKYQSDAQFKPDYDGEYYHEPWVSLTDATSEVKEFIWLNAEIAYYQVPYVAEYLCEVDGYYKWLTWEASTEKTNTNRTCWTRVRNPEVGDKVFIRYPNVIDPEGHGYDVTEVTKLCGKRVDYNKGPYNGEGFVFDAADTRVVESAGLILSSGTKTLKCLHEDRRYTTLTPTNRLTHGEMYLRSQLNPYDYLQETGTTLPVKIVNAKSIDPAFDDEITVNIPFVYSSSYVGKYLLPDYHGHEITFLNGYLWNYDGTEISYVEPKPAGSGFALMVN